MDHNFLGTSWRFQVLAAQQKWKGNLDVTTVARIGTLGCWHLSGYPSMPVQFVIVTAEQVVAHHSIRFKSVTIAPF
jgi:hypothetical protein